MPKFELTTTAQVERVFVVEAADDEQARKRLTTWKHDPEVFAEGIVVEAADKARDTTPMRIKASAPVKPVLLDTGSMKPATKKSSAKQAPAAAEVA